MAFTGPIDDQLAIRTLHDRYADAVFRRDAAAWGMLWADDARWDLMDRTVDGQSAIVAMWTGAMASFAFVAFFAQVGAIEVDGSSAAGRVYTNEVLEDHAGAVARTVGRYDDRYVRGSDGWRYQARTFTSLKG